MASCSSDKAINVQALSYAVPNSQHCLFSNICCTFMSEKIGLVGRNGIGKTTFVRLLINELIPDEGQIATKAKIGYLPQETNFTSHQTIADIFGIADKIKALHAIENGAVDEHLFETIQDDWLVKDRLAESLQTVGLPFLSFDSNASTLSGGQKTRVILASLLFDNVDFLILDEPTNNLDATSKQWLLEFLKQWEHGLLIISHDRTLLNIVDKIYEFTSNGLVVYGGNYEHYKAQKEQHQLALKGNLERAKKELKQTKQELQAAKERQQKKDNKAKRDRKSSNQAKIILDRAKNSNESAKKRMSKITSSRISEKQLQQKKYAEQFEIEKAMDFTFSGTCLPSRKIVLTLDNVSFSFEPGKYILKDFSLQIIGPERIWLQGDNGSGKTTLMRLITGQLQPDSGTISVSVENIAYLDQFAIMLNHDISVFENLKQINSELNDQECYSYLAKFLFRGDGSMQLVKQLSGGEKIRAALACTLLSSSAPQLILLDEPTNHLDLESVECMEHALNQYQGSLLVSSHDSAFYKAIDITRTIHLGNNIC